MEIPNLQCLLQKAADISNQMTELEKLRLAVRLAEAVNVSGKVKRVSCHQAESKFGNPLSGRRLRA